MSTWNQPGPVEPGNEIPAAGGYGQPAASDIAPAPAGTPARESAGAIIGEIVQTIALALVIFLGIRMVLQNFRIEGSSMEPNFHDGQFLFINRWAYCPGLHLDVPTLNIHLSETRCLWQPQRGDVIVFRYPRDPSKDYIKRVIALPGERVEVRNGEVLIDGQPLNEPFRPNPGSYTSPPTVVPEGQVYVMGDNRNNSSDSHLWGPLPNSYIVGRAWVSYWPWWDWGVVKTWPASAFGLRQTVTNFLEKVEPLALGQIRELSTGAIAEELGKAAGAQFARLPIGAGAIWQVTLQEAGRIYHGVE